jgi:phosphatidylglycerol:prolipoprotein diacylglycerol transferase
LGVFPYLQIPPLHLGPLTLYPFRTLVAMGVLVGYFTMMRRTRRAGLDSGRAAALCVSTLIPGFLGAHWFKLLYQPGRLAADLWAFLRIMSGISSFGGIAGGLAGVAIFFWSRPIPAREMWRYLDLLGYSFLCGMVFGRIGCFQAHDHPGFRTTSWLAVRYPGGSRYDLALLELIAIFVLLALFRMWARFGWPAGSYLGVVLVLYPAFRLWLDTLHEHPVRYWGISLDQLASAACLAVGLAILRSVSAKRSPPSPAGA